MSYYDRDKSPNNGGTTVGVGGTMGWPVPHLGHAPEYQVSGFPFVYTWNNSAVANGTIVQVDLPFVARWIIISGHHNNDKVANDHLHIAFNKNGFTSGNYVDGRFSSDIRLEIKCSKVYFRLTDSSGVDHVEIIAGLTSIPSSSFDNIHTLANAANGGSDIIGVNTAPTVTVNP